MLRQISCLFVLSVCLSRVLPHHINSCTYQNLSFKKGYIIFSAPKCFAEVDICFIVDSSGSIRDTNAGGIDNWGLQRDFLLYVVSAFTVGRFRYFFEFFVVHSSVVNVNMIPKCTISTLKC